MAKHLAKELVKCTGCCTAKRCQATQHLQSGLCGVELATRDLQMQSDDGKTAWFSSHHCRRPLQVEDDQDIGTAHAPAPTPAPDHCPPSDLASPSRSDNIDVEVFPQHTTSEGTTDSPHAPDVQKWPLTLRGSSGRQSMRPSMRQHASCGWWRLRMAVRKSSLRIRWDSMHHGFRDISAGKVRMAKL